MADRKGLLIVLSGFSGAGKGTIMKHLLEEHPGMYNLSISATTRKMRVGEADGREYFFKTVKEFESMIKHGELLEHANFNGNYYGTPKPYVMELLEQGKDVILEIEVQGALQVKKIFPDAILLFVTPPDAVTLKNRLVGRATETSDVIAERLAISCKESELMSKYDYLIINDSIETAVNQVHNIIQSEHFKTAKCISQIEKIQDELKIYSKGDN